MSQPRSPEDIIHIPDIPPSMEMLRQQFHHPDDLDEMTRNLNIPPFLLNFHLATSADLSSVDLGQAIHIPVQITRRKGGRKSLYYLKAGEEVLAGIFVTNQGIALRFIKRVTGKSLPARTGDIYEQRITNREGELVSRSEGKLEVINPQEFTGRFLPVLPTASSALETQFGIWFLGSLIYVHTKIYPTENGQGNKIK